MPRGCIKAANYVGRVSMTISGHVCMDWASRQGKLYSNKEYNFGKEESESAAKNYCRGADGDKFVSCLVSSRGVKYEACSVDFCGMLLVLEMGQFTVSLGKG